MKKENNNKRNQENNSAQEGNARFSGKKDVTDDAREEAMGDIEEDADLGIHGSDDLDEGETARLGENRNDLI